MVMDFFDPESDGIVQPREMVKLFTTSRGVREEDLSLPSVAIVTFSRRMLDGFVQVAGGNRFESWRGRNSGLFLATVGDRAIVLTKSPQGAPNAVILVEELVAFGVRRAIFVGYCGSIQSEVAIGDLVLPTQAVREEGTSYHYLPRGVQCRPDGLLLHALRQRLQQKGVAANPGAIWTTDALYRETEGKIERYRAKGILAVEMEMSALFALGAVRTVGVVALLLVSDHFFHKSWTPGFFHPRLLEREGLVAGIILDWMKEGGSPF